MNRRGIYFVYIVRCADGTFYTGYTKDLANRLRMHNSGRGSKYVRSKRPVVLAYAHQYKYFKNALNAERRIKTYSRSRKASMIKSYERKGS